MFDYDRDLNIVQQLASNSPNNFNENTSSQMNMSKCSLDASFDHLEDKSTTCDSEEDNNCIVHGLEELLRRCSSARQTLIGNGHRRSSISSEQLYCTPFSSPQPSLRQRSYTNAMPDYYKYKGQAPRRFSGGSTNVSEIFDCDVSSGYGSPTVETPLSSPVAANIAKELQKMFIDQGFCEGVLSTSLGSNGTTMATRKDAINLLGPSSVIQPNGLPTLIKATTTTTGTNKNSNKRKTSVVGNRNSSPGPQLPTVEQIVPSEDGFDINEIVEFTHLLTSPKRPPPPNYVCHICYKPGHYISDCPQRFNSPYEELTPYQGRKKCYGEFQCEQCKRKWTSQNSVANEAQSCVKCHIPVFPHKQLPVDKAIALGLVKLERCPATRVFLANEQDLVVPSQENLEGTTISQSMAPFYGFREVAQMGSPANSPPLAI